VLLTEVTVDVLVDVCCKYDEQKSIKLNPGGLFYGKLSSIFLYEQQLTEYDLVLYRNHPRSFLTLNHGES